MSTTRAVGSVKIMLWGRKGRELDDEADTANENDGKKRGRETLTQKWAQDPANPKNPRIGRTRLRHEPPQFDYSSYEIYDDLQKLFKYFSRDQTSGDNEI